MHALSTQADLSTLRDLVRSDTGVASVFLGAPSLGTAPDLEARRRSLASRLIELGTDHDTVRAVTEHIAGMASPYQAAIYACAGAVRLSRRLSEVDSMDRACFGTPAVVLPVLAWLQAHPPYVVVVIDRAGADVTPVPEGEVTGETLVVVGPDDEIGYRAPGGWSQPRYHRRAVDSWQHNAAAAARTAAYAVERIEAGLLLLAGDAQAAHLFRAQLPHGLRTRIQLRTVPGGRSADGSWPARQAAIAAAVRHYVDEHSLALRDRVRADLGHGGEAVDGVDPTLAALADGRVETLLVADDPADRRRAWFGPGYLCADAPRPDGSTPFCGRLADVAVRAALLTDARVRVLSPTVAAGLGERIGARCRFS